jgi:hypothetical protein
MNGTVFIRRHGTRATWVWQALLIVLAIGPLACDGPAVTPIGPTPIPGRPTSPSPTMLGFYEVTMSAGPSCSLPDYATKAKYGEARVTQLGQSLDVLFDPSGPFGALGFGGIIDGQNVRITLHESIALVNNVEVAYFGTAVCTMDGRSIVGTFDGTVQVRLPSDHTVIATCTASDHRMEMVRY